MQIVTLRVPGHWAGRLGSEDVQDWMADYLRSPVPLPPDPGAGPTRISLSLPPRAVKVFSALADESVSAALRRLAALRLRALPEPPTYSLAAPVDLLPVEPYKPALAFPEPPLTTQPSRMTRGQGMTPEQYWAKHDALVARLHAEGFDVLGTQPRNQLSVSEMPDSVETDWGWLWWVALAVGVGWLLLRHSKNTQKAVQQILPSAAMPQFKPWVPVA